ncbi:unnamed protein product [Arabidopsis halleri]
MIVDVNNVKEIVFVSDTKTGAASPVENLNSLIPENSREKGLSFIQTKFKKTPVSLGGGYQIEADAYRLEALGLLNFSPARVLALLRWLDRFSLLLNGGFIFSDRDSRWCTAAAFLDLFLLVHGRCVFWLLGLWWSSKGGWLRRLRLILCGGCRRGPPPPRLLVSSLSHGSKCGSSGLLFELECGGLVLLRCGNGFYVHYEKFSPRFVVLRCFDWWPEAASLAARWCSCATGFEYILSSGSVFALILGEAVSVAEWGEKINQRKKKHILISVETFLSLRSSATTARRSIPIESAGESVSRRSSITCCDLSVDISLDSGYEDEASPI